MATLHGDSVPLGYACLQEMNVSGSHLLFRDKRRQLHLYDVAAQSRTCLLSFCEYVQWVPRSSVVVAQSRAKLCVWYSAKHPDRCGAQ